MGAEIAVENVELVIAGTLVDPSPGTLAARVLEFARIAHQARLASDGEFHHGRAVERAALGNVAVRRLCARHQAQLRQLQTLHQLQRGAQMSVVHGIKGTTEDSHQGQRG